LLGRRHYPAENRIAMGKAPEAFHDIAMAPGISPSPAAPVACTRLPQAPGPRCPQNGRREDKRIFKARALPADRGRRQSRLRRSCARLHRSHSGSFTRQMRRWIAVNPVIWF